MASKSHTHGSSEEGSTPAWKKHDHTLYKATRLPPDYPDKCIYISEEGPLCAIHQATSPWRQQLLARLRTGDLGWVPPDTAPELQQRQDQVTSWEFATNIT